MIKENRCGKETFINWHWANDVVPVCEEHQLMASGVSMALGIPPHFTQRSEVGYCTQVVDKGEVSE